MPRVPRAARRRAARQCRARCRAYGAPGALEAATAGPATLALRAERLAIGTDAATALKSKAGLANASLAYELFEKTFAEKRAPVWKAK